MRYPALSRMLGVFLAVVSLISCAAGCLGFGKAAGDYREQQREDELLQSRITQAEELLRQLDELQPGYDEVAGDYPELLDSHRAAGSDYRMELATYTATRAGLKLGRKQMDEAAAALDESMQMFLTGFYMFQSGEASFQKVYDIYLTLRSSIDQGRQIYSEAAARLPEDGDENAEVEFTPEEVLALAELGHGTYAQLGDLLGSLKEDIPVDQRQVSSFVRQAVEDYNEVSPELDNFSVEMLAYGVSRELYDQANAALDAQTAEGASAEDARAAADQICMDSFGLSFDELGQWLEENEPESTASGESSAIPPEMMDLLLNEMPSDRDLVDVAIGLIADSDRDLSEKEAAFRADPHSMSAAELLLAAYAEGIDSAQRVLGLVEPQILETKEQMDSARAQLDSAFRALRDGKLQIDDGYKELRNKGLELVLKLIKMKLERSRLDNEKRSLDEIGAIVDGYESVQDRFRTLRAELLADDGVYTRHKAGEELLDAAKGELALRIPAHRSEVERRRVMCAVMIAGGLVGLLAALGAFEKPKIKRLWLPLSGAALISAAAEAISFSLGRGLLYSSLFVVIFAFLLLPLCIGGRKGDPV